MQTQMYITEYITMSLNLSNINFRCRHCRLSKWCGFEFASLHAANFRFLRCSLLNCRTEPSERRGPHTTCHWAL